jgi:hypothetical protein
MVPRDPGHDSNRTGICVVTIRTQAETGIVISLRLNPDIDSHRTDTQLHFTTVSIATEAVRTFLAEFAQGAADHENPLGDDHGSL